MNENSRTKKAKPDSQGDQFYKVITILSAVTLVVLILFTVSLISIGSEAENWEKRIMSSNTTVERYEGGYRVVERYLGTEAIYLFIPNTDGTLIYYKREGPDVASLATPRGNPIHFDEREFRDPEERVSQALEEKLLQ